MYARGPEIHAEISLLMEKLAALPTPPMPKAREWKGPSSCNTMISRVPLESPFFQGRNGYSQGLPRGRIGGFDMELCPVELAS